MPGGTPWPAGQGVRQFLDIWTGIPTEPNLHQVAQRVVPEARGVYCDNDPIVPAHAGALLRGTSEGDVDYVQADARGTVAILEHARKTMDFDRSIALSLIALLHFISDEDGAYELVDHLKDALDTGSYLTVSHLTPDFHPEETSRKVSDLHKAGGLTMDTCSRKRFARFFGGLEPVAPGVVAAEDWHPELGEPVPGQGDVHSGAYVAVARKSWSRPERARRAPGPYPCPATRHGIRRDFAGAGHCGRTDERSTGLLGKQKRGCAKVVR